MFSCYVTIWASTKVYNTRLANRVSIIEYALEAKKVNWITKNAVFQLFWDEFYVIAENALKLDRSLLMPLETYENLRDVYPVVISYTLKKLGNSVFWKNALTWVLFLPIVPKFSIYGKWWRKSLSLNLTEASFPSTPWTDSRDKSATSSSSRS